LADHPLADDVAFFEVMFDFMATRYSIDARRIYVSGFSNGGQMSSRLAVELSTRVAAVAANSGGLAIDPVPAVRPLSVILTLGAIDPGISAVVGESPVPLTESLMATSPAFRDAFISPFLTSLSLSDAYSWATQTIRGEATSQFLFETSTVGASNSFRVVIVEDLEHMYPNGTNHAIEMANVLWEFFKSQALPWDS
jgi:polyhydroxybutyrate depolymerase